MRLSRLVFLAVAAVAVSAVVVGCEASSRPARQAPASAHTGRVEPDSALALRVARERFGVTAHVRMERSTGDRFLLVTRSAPTTALQPIVLTSYAIVERRTGRVTASEQDVRGFVRWLDAATVEVTLSPGTVQGDPSMPIGSPQGPPRYRVRAATGEHV